MSAGSAISSIRALAGVCNAQLGVPVRITRYGRTPAATHAQDDYNAQTGASARAVEGLFETIITMPMAGVSPAVGLAEIESGTGKIQAGDATSGTYFDPRKSDEITFLDGTLSGMTGLVTEVVPVAAGGARQLAWSINAGSAGSVGAGTEPD